MCDPKNQGVLRVPGISITPRGRFKSVFLHTARDPSTHRIIWAGGIIDRREEHRGNSNERLIIVNASIEFADEVLGSKGFNAT